ncbi:hypothetical protein DY000_02037782 [Brassica cretica]|uniref:Uncharacterized protein n=1 Tax=Brassica cretica TaxID=69181 RepID=A0ABQ7BHW7_BRACR|nr:hypothetical protein DY000_02037782 [Brassica cretica]
MFTAAGDPLLEIVFEPDMRSGIEAAEYTGELRRILRHILNIFQFYPTVNLSSTEMGKPSSMAFFFAGQVMRMSKGKINPDLLNKILEEKSMSRSN